jgi:hypothetical protein
MNTTKIKTIAKQTWEIISGILVLLLFCFYIGFIFNYYFLKDQEKISWSGSTATITECRFPFGSWFNKDSFVIEYNRFIFKGRSILGDQEVYFPFSKVKKIKFIEAIYWYSLSLKHEGFLSLSKPVYFKNKDTLKFLNTVIGYTEPNIVICKNSNILANLFK